MAEVKFQVGEVYSNRDGQYKVLAIDTAGGRMEVRFLEGGLTRSLDMTIQARICSNLKLEAKMAEGARLEKVAKAAKPTAEKKALGRDFHGMRSEDFNGTVIGTTWRNRDSLAGAVRARLQRHFKKPFKSSAVYNWPVVFLSHQPEVANAAEGSARIAKYTVQADASGLRYGLYAELVDGECHDWDRLVKKLREDDTLRKFAAQLEKEGLKIEGRRVFGKKGVEPLWSPKESWENRLKALEAPLEAGETRELYLVRSMSVDEAVSKGTDLVDEIGDAFVKLAPFYSAATA